MFPIVVRRIGRQTGKADGQSPPVDGDVGQVDGLVAVL